LKGLASREKIRKSGQNGAQRRDFKKSKEDRGFGGKGVDILNWGDERFKGEPPGRKKSTEKVGWEKGANRALSPIKKRAREVDLKGG